MARLRRVSDGAGDEGSMVQALGVNEMGVITGVVDSKPVVGCVLLVGSTTARSYSHQDYWMTTIITEIIEERKNENGKLTYFRFRTKNSEYELFY